ncbi:neutral/alkaline non-lysosomal ceramidase N-terminal domain-containing protein [Cohnella silvisoli]|uniref:Neutral/alkaline non-lysosomal ceramidase N-terminal domain-containing protein n=1 Tax=Cohnella silvisoli TaxID=2873699 RepID=A0ABV1KX07_9BACL|nr:neutral/alkaline non-lysosomal ceramidase N-terminal domain-containing protein [Cohnella silvisoli]MCD9023855.1 neutral/alkaline non-lysosomal ceramidase N-terminal domain-containing protein [Cohnella silvisoli]
MKCGMSEIDITPPLGSAIPGYFYDRKATGIKDRLYAKALVVQADEGVVAIVALDCIDLTSAIVAGIRERIAAFTPIPQSCIMVSATHTHTGPPVISTSFYEADDQYLSWMTEQAADAAIAAYQQRRNAQIGFGAGHEPDIAFNRRFYMKDGTVKTNPGIGNPFIDRPTGPIDPQVFVMRIDDDQGNPIGVLTNYACHTDVVGGTEFSADYPGELSFRLKQELGDDVVSLFHMGTSGNINHANAMGGTEADYDPSLAHYKKMGRILSWEVLKVREKITTSTSKLPLAVKQTVFPVPYRLPSEKDVQAVQQIQLGDWPQAIKDNFVQELRKAANAEDTSFVEVEIQVITLGELAFVGLPGELFVEFGLEIKEKSPFPFTIVNELCNGSATGYFCTRIAYEQGGYEPIITGHSRLAIDAGEIFVQQSLKLLQDIGQIRGFLV